MQHSLNPTETRVIQLLLSRLPVSEAERIKQGGVRSSTYFTVRRRALQRGWVQLQYVPDPRPLGVRRVVFQVGLPFAENWEEVVRAWGERRGVVLLWRFRDTLFSVTWDTSETSTPRPSPIPIEPVPASPLLRNVWTVEVDADSGDVPVYFDFEGAWARWSGSGQPLSYPTRLGTLADEAGDEGLVSLSQWERGEVGRLMDARGGVKAVSERAVGPTARAGPEVPFAPSVPDWLHRWVFPDFQRLPSVSGRHIEHVIFVTGLLREGRRPEALVEALFRDAQLAPFLVAYGKSRLLLGLLAPRPPTAGGHAVPVMGVLQEALREVEIQRDSISTLIPLIDHRYSALLPNPEGPKEPPGGS